MKPKLLITGAQGQLGRTFCRHWLTSNSAENYELQALSRRDMDLADASAIAPALDKIRPLLLINAAAYTGVDLAESEPELAFQVNEHAVAAMGQWCADNGAKMLQISTDFVFNGESNSPYLPQSATSPLGVYGASKLAGEQRLAEILPDRHAVVRTSWLYSEHGNNFVKTMLRLMAELPELGIVNDQIGSPTSTHTLTGFILGWIVSGCPAGRFHWNDGASISWFDFAQAIQNAGVEAGILAQAIPLKPIATKDYPTPAVRPAYSVMDRSHAEALLQNSPGSWQDELKRVVSTFSSQ